MPKQELVDAAVAVIVTRANLALEGQLDGWRDGYSEVSHVAGRLRDAGLISHPNQDRSGTAGDEARRSLEGKAKRLLDAELARGEQSRILRFLAQDAPKGGWPQLDGNTRPPYGNSTYYTTPDMYAAAQAAVQAEVDQLAADRQAMADLLKEAAAAGLPQPIGHGLHQVTYDMAGVRQLIEKARQ
jgi:hypothetical protein